MMPVQVLDIQVPVWMALWDKWPGKQIGPPRKCVEGEGFEWVRRDYNGDEWVLKV